jgi:hypothetical protein
MTRNQDASRDEKENEYVGETLTGIVLCLTLHSTLLS